MTALFWLTLWVGTGGWVALFVAIAGNRDLAAENRELMSGLADADRAIRELEADRITTTRTNVRPIRESPSFAPVAEILARNEAARANWDDIKRWLP